MKSLLKISVSLLLLTGTAFCEAENNSFTEEAEMHSFEFINVNHIDQQMLTDIMEGRLPYVALEIKKGQRLPLRLSLQGDLIELSGGDESLSLTTNQNLYIRNVNGQFLCCTNSFEWRPFAAFITGSINMNLNVEEEGTPSLVFEAIVNERK